MTQDAVFVFGLIGVAGALMASNRVRFDVVALLVLIALMLSGVLTVAQTLAGFGNSVVILVAGLLVVGEMLARTGVARAVGDWILKQGGTDEKRLLVLIMIAAALLGAVMSSTAVVAIFIPIVLRIAAETNLKASRLLMPMSYAALISGMLTLIATAPNLVVHEELKAAGYDGFGFFAFSPVGFAVLGIAVVYVLVIAGRMLGKNADEATQANQGRSIREIWHDFQVGESIFLLRVEADSPLVGQTLSESELDNRFGLRVVGIRRIAGRNEERIASPTGDTELHAGDSLLVATRPECIEQATGELSVTAHPVTERDKQRWLWELGGAAVLIHPDSTMIGKSVRDVGFRSTHRLQVLGLRRAQKVVADFEDVPLQSSDSLFVVGPWTQIQHLQSLSHDFVVLEVPAEKAEIVPSYRKMPIALLILAAMVLLTIFQVVPLVAAVLMAMLAAVFTRCLSMEEAYRAIPLSSLVLIAGMLPLADALDATGGTDLIVEAIMTAVGDSGPRVMLTVIFFLTAGLGLILSNTASAVLVAPIAITAAEALSVSPYPFAVAVLVAASAAYSTPVSTPVVTLVVEPGRYRFIEFVKVGVPLLLLTFVATLIVTPLIFSFNAS